MFRFIHAADLHLDSPLQGLAAHEGAPIEAIRGATRRAFENLVELAIAEQIDFLLIAGDVYDRDWKDYNTGLFFRRQMVRLRDQGIPVYLISGNHDAASIISRKLQAPENVHEFSTRGAESKEVAGLPVVIHGRGFPNRAVVENLAKDYPAPVSQKFNIGLLHTSLDGRPGHDTYAPCSEKELRDKGYGYWALGHIHQPDIVSRDPYIVFAGNCQGRHVNEAGPRGCWLVTVDEALEVQNVAWQNLDVVRWAELRVDLDGIATEFDALRQVRQALAEAVSRAEGRLLAARVVLGGRTALHGSFCREAERWSAEILSAAQDHGEQAIWIERVQVATAPVYDTNELAQRDSLTKLVLESLDPAVSALQELPGEIEEMLALLPLEIRQDFEQEWQGERRVSVLTDVRAIILDALGSKGGQNV